MRLSTIKKLPRKPLSPIYNRILEGKNLDTTTLSEKDFHHLERDLLGQTIEAIKHHIESFDIIKIDCKELLNFLDLARKKIMDNEWNKESIQIKFIQQRINHLPDIIEESLLQKHQIVKELDPISESTWSKIIQTMKNILTEQPPKAKIDKRTLIKLSITSRLGHIKYALIRQTNARTSQHN